jgi:hypothetical protein
MAEDGVMGYMAMTSLVRWATDATASFASIVSVARDRELGIEDENTGSVVVTGQTSIGV